MTMTEARASRCAHCGAYFEYVPNNPNQPVRLYCKPTHAKSAWRKAKKVRSNYRPGYCPTPHKRSFENSTDAIAAIAAQWPVVQTSRPYLCSCGKFHTGRPKRDG